MSKLLSRLQVGLIIEICWNCSHNENTVCTVGLGLAQKMALRREGSPAEIVHLAFEGHIPRRLQSSLNKSHEVQLQNRHRQPRGVPFLSTTKTAFRAILNPEATPLNVHSFNRSCSTGNSGQLSLHSKLQELQGLLPLQALRGSPST